VLAWLLIAVIAFVQIKIFQKHWYVTVVYLFLLVQLPMIAVIRTLRKAAFPKDFHRVSNFIKLVMLTGIVSMIFFKMYF
jgi:4-hydroxybenzoate polyprenyltransferase